MSADTLKAAISEIKSMQQDFNGRCARLIAFLEQELKNEEAALHADGSIISAYSTPKSQTS